MNTAVIKLNTLTDAVGPAPQHEDFFTVTRCSLTLLFIGGVHIGRGRRKFRRAGVHPLIDGADTQGPAMSAHSRFGGAQYIGDAFIGEAPALQTPYQGVVELID